VSTWILDRAHEALQDRMEAEDVATRVDLLERVLPEDIREGDRILWVPGRIEILGKHTDYAGGRSLLAATHRGMWIVVRPRPDRTVLAIDRVREERTQFDLSPDLIPMPGWANYLSTVGRRLSRNFGSLRGADFFFGSDLPLAAGMSSSSALIVAFSLGLIGTNAIEESENFTNTISSLQDLSGYLGTVENGQSFGPLSGDRGVGTFGGSEDHTAILTCKKGHFEQYSFCPIRHEGSIPFLPSVALAIGVSGVVAQKTGEAMDRYNRASRLASAVLEGVNAGKQSKWTTLADAIREQGVEETRRALSSAPPGEFTQAEIRERLDQFVEESERLVQEAADALAREDPLGFGSAVSESQSRGARLLRNQVEETEWLCDSAVRQGSITASAFGAGFGGSVWAAVPESEVDEFLASWESDYHTKFPSRSCTSEFFVTHPSSAAFELTA